jgi:hypothetical protein
MAVPEVKTGTPALQPPGAGLPWWELLTAKYLYFPHVCRNLTWAAAGALFQVEGAKILAIWDGLPAEKLTERVLVRRLTGLEDSSRHWSAAMTVEHLNIVGAGIRRTIGSLRQGSIPAKVARVEDVKPKGEADPAEVRAEFVGLLEESAAAEKSEPPIPRGQGPRYNHPWFGPINAHQWHCLLGIHQGLHRKQLEAIRAGLGV